MSNFCGGFNLGTNLKLINGIICKSDVTTVDATKAISVCGQLWDGTAFKVVGKVITAIDSTDTPVAKRAVCSIKLDNNVFEIGGNAVDLKTTEEEETE